MANSQSSGAGLFGFALQGALGATKGTAVTGNHHFLPVLSASIGADQRVTSLPQEIGGPLWQRGSFKHSVAVGGDVSFNLRPRKIGYLLYALTGAYGTAGSAATSDANLRGHNFAPNMNPGEDLPWLTLVRHLPNGPSEMFVDCVVRNFRLDVPSNSVVSCSMGFVGITPREIPTVALTDLSAGQLDNLQPLLTCTGSVTLTNSNSAPATRISVDITNELSMDEFTVGSYELNDITLLSRSLSVSFDTFVRDATLYRAVMRGGAAVGAPSDAGGAAWSGTLVRGALTLLVKSAGNAVEGNLGGAPTNPDYLKLYIPSLDFLTFPIAVAGNNLVRATLAAQLTLVAGSNDEATAMTTADITTMKRPFVMQLGNAYSDNYAS